MAGRNWFRVSAIAGAALLIAVVIGYREAEVEASPAGSVTGTIKLDGAPPHQKPIDMSKEPSCEAVHKSGPATAETVVATSSGSLKNVVVYISQGWNGPARGGSANPVFDQKGCQYLPHVLALNPEQQFTVKNSDAALHNVHPMPKAGGQNREWNKSQAPGAAPIAETWPAEEVAIHVKCNIHPWMSGYMVVVKGPFSVSDDKGNFRLENLPPGAYTLTAWQETLGTQTQSVTVAAGKPAIVNFTFKAK